MNQNSKPKYEVIMEDLLAKIHSKDFSYDTVFCTEKQLSEQYKVSRITAKRAITDLEQKGILYRKRGVGSFVARNALNNMNRPVVSGSNSKIISFLLPFDSAKGNMFQTMGVVKDLIDRNGYFMSIYISDISSAREKANIKLLLSQNISGLVYYPIRDKIYLDLLNKFVYMGIPVVVIDKSTDCPYIHNVVSDNFEGGRLLTDHLIQLGHRNIGFFTTAPLDETSSVRNRFAGYLHQLQAAGIKPNLEHFVHYPYDLTEEAALAEGRNPFHNAIQSMYNAGITAIIAENDLVAYFIHMACRKIGLRIPEDISLCGFDNTEFSQKLDITSVKQDFPAIGEHIGRILMESISNPAAPIRKITVPVELVIRSSSGAPA